jgi:hypothetical protein
MTILNSRHCLLMAAVALIAGCGKQERIEAVQFAQALAGKKTVFDSANSAEQGFVKSARGWCANITANGAGRGAELDKNAAMATELAKSAVAISGQLSQVRQTIDGLTIQEEYARGVRNELRGQLTKRQRTLQEMRSLLEESAPQFLGYKQDKAYAGDSYPDTIVKLDAMLKTHRHPEDAVGAASTALQSKYGLNEAEVMPSQNPPKS